jgi:hypothetical protein
MRKPTGAVFDATSVTLLALAALLTGCAVVYEGKYDADEGWRLGRIEKIGPASDFGAPRSLDCRQQGAVDAQLRYAEVDFRVGRHTRTRIVALPAGSTYLVDDLVYVNVTSCERALVKRNSDPAL